jgi:DNA mismatch repair protein MutS
MAFFLYYKFEFQMKNADKPKEITPLMKQYFQVKEKHPGALILFRVGDFYETFGEDAIKASGILGIVLTKRGAGSSSEIELAGFPYHSLDNYLPKLVRAGHRVAVCDQLEDPKMVKGIVKRGVTELVTPGVVLNDHVLNIRQNNYLCSVYFLEQTAGVAFLDISTGDFFTTQGDFAYIDKIIQSFNPSEFIYSKPQKNVFFARFDPKIANFAVDEWVFQFDYGYENLIQHFGTLNLKGFGIEDLKEGIIASGAILYYLKLTEHHEIAHIVSIARIEEERFMWLDKFTMRNLELVGSQHSDGISLIQVIDQTITPMASRLLNRWLLMPLKEKDLIENRLASVDFFYQNMDFSKNLQDKLAGIGDLERIISKVAAKRINPREVVQLKKALTQISVLKLLFETEKIPSDLKKKIQLLNPCDFIIEKIQKELLETVSVLSNNGNIICNNVSSELDELRQIANNGKDFLNQITNKEIERTGISSLKIQFNKVFGYYLEVTNAHKSKVPEDWIRKQTTVNGERYITQELKLYEEKILTAEDKIVGIEQQIFNDLVTILNGYVAIIQQNAKIVAEIDCLLSFSVIAHKNHYVKPKLFEGTQINIIQGRHPVIEHQLPKDEKYIANDILLDEKQQIIIITGPNMAGKSALLRQTALIVILAQIGSFVPADAAEIGIVDKVFTRVGGSDNLSKGESTFMIEMTETASILNNLSHRSLVLMDEIGRGTSTYDGISIAWAIVEHLHNHPKFKPKTLFATHYHELNELAKDLERVKNFNVSVKEAGNKIIFMRKLAEGGAEHSFGIHVAQMAGIPNQVVIRANEIMHELEKDKMKDKNIKKIKEIPKQNHQTSLFVSDNPKFKQAKELIDKTDVNILTPIEALLRLSEIKNLIN